MLNDNSALPGDLKKREIKIDGQDISAMVLAANVYLDVVGGIWSCQLFIEDATNLLTTMPIKSGLPVKVKVETNFDGSVGDGEKEFEFVVYNITDKVATNHMQYNYTIHCASKSFINDQKKRVNKYFEGTADQAVQSVISEELSASIKDSRPAEGNVQFIATNWTPLNTAAFAAKWAKYNGKSDFMVFQSDNDKFDFIPVSAMFEERRLGHVFIQRPSGIRENHEHKDDPALLITSYQNDHYDAARAGLHGYFGSKNAEFDLKTKQWKVEDFSTEAEGAENEFADFKDANISFTPKHKGMYDGQDNVYDTAKEWMGSRRAELQRLDREKIFVQTAACAACWEWLGHTVKIDLPSMEDNTTEQFDKDRRGHYLITAIALMLNRADAVVNYEMVKLKLGE